MVCKEGQELLTTFRTIKDAITPSRENSITQRVLPPIVHCLHLERRNVIL